MNEKVRMLGFRFNRGKIISNRESNRKTAVVEMVGALLAFYIINIVLRVNPLVLKIVLNLIVAIDLWYFTALFLASITFKRDIQEEKPKEGEKKINQE